MSHDLDQAPEATDVPWSERYAGSVMNTFGPPKLVLERGEGSYVWDVAGKRYLDLLGGIAVNVLGHRHPAVIEAVEVSAAALEVPLRVAHHPDEVRAAWPEAALRLVSSEVAARWSGVAPGLAYIVGAVGLGVWYGLRRTPTNPAQQEAR